VCLSVFLSAWKNWATAGQKFVKWYMNTKTSKICRKFKRNWSTRRKRVTCMKMYIRCSYGNIWLKIYGGCSYGFMWLNCYQKKKRQNLCINSKHILCSVNTTQNYVYHELMCKKDRRPKQARDKEITRYAYWITEARGTHKDCVIHVDFSHQVWLSERVSMIPYMCSACLFQ